MQVQRQPVFMCLKKFVKIEFQNLLTKLSFLYRLPDIIIACW